MCVLPPNPCTPVFPPGGASSLSPPHFQVLFSPCPFCVISTPTTTRFLLLAARICRWHGKAGRHNLGVKMVAPPTIGPRYQRAGLQFKPGPTHTLVLHHTTSSSAHYTMVTTSPAALQSPALCLHLAPLQLCPTGVPGRGLHHPYVLCCNASPRPLGQGKGSWREVDPSPLAASATEAMGGSVVGWEPGGPQF